MKIEVTKTERIASETADTAEDGPEVEILRKK